MAQADSSLSNMQRGVQDALGAHWKLFLFQGIVMIIFGVIAVLVPVAATIAVDYFVGWLFLFGGIMGLVAMFSTKDIPAFLWSLVTAALNLVVGVLLIWKPAQGALSLTLVLTAFFIAEGIFQIVASIGYRDVIRGSWGWMLFSGICDLVLAGIIIWGFPFTAAWTLGLIVGINLITSGWAIVAAAIEGRQILNAVLPPTAAAHR